MQWTDVRQHFPDQWVLMETVKAHSDNGKLIIEEVSVLNHFADSTEMFREYARLHHESPLRALVFFHTSREILDIEILDIEILDIQERHALPLSPLTASYNAVYDALTPEEIEEERRLLEGIKRKVRAVLEPW